MASNTKRTLYLLFIFILLLTNVVAGYYWWNSNKDVEKITVEKSELQTEYMQVQQELNTQMAALEEMKGQNAELDAIIKVREQELKDQQAKITKLFKEKNFSASDLKKAKDMIASLQQQNADFMKKIDDLNIQNQVLTEEKELLETDLTGQKEINTALEEKNKKLGSKVELGSLLRADELTVTGIFVKNSGAEKDIDKIKKIEKLKVCYQTGNNAVRETGKVNMYMRIITPSGTTLYNEANGSGTLTSKEGEEIRYSKKADFDFDGSNKNVCIYWTQALTEQGNYKAMIYQDGFLVGETTVELK